MICRDHPREYGENVSKLTAKQRALGSSPRIRGEWDVVDTLRGLDGIIPANTGRISTAPRNTAARRDHPREYGENVAYVLDQVHAFGIIPANTGRMPTLNRVCSAWRDHPREYGENVASAQAVKRVPGSSPRIRGE